MVFEYATPDSTLTNVVFPLMSPAATKVLFYFSKITIEVIAG